MRKRNRLLSLILVVILVVSMLVPVSAFADSGEYNVVLHANRAGKGYAKWNSATQVYDYSESKTTTVYDDETYLSEPETNPYMYPDYNHDSEYEWSNYYDGYDFDGWADASGKRISNGSYVNVSDLNSSGTTHLYALWKKTSYVITLDAGTLGSTSVHRTTKDGSTVTTRYSKACDSRSINNDSASYRMFYPDEYQAVPNNSSAYAFDGWYYDAAFRSPVPDAGFSVSSDITLYAKFISKAEANATKAAATSYYNKAAKAAKKLKVSGSKASAAGKKKANVKWKANKKASGYQIQYSLKKNFKNAKTVNVKGAKKKLRKLKGMKKGKTYYIRIRTYQNVLSVNNTKVPVYGKWSKKMKVKVK